MSDLALLIIDSDAGSQSFNLAAGSHVIGQDPSCDVVIDSLYIAPRHARLTISEGGFKLEDLSQPEHPISRSAYPGESQLGALCLRVQQIGASPFALTKEKTYGDHYTKGEEIARGGMGAILEADDEILGRTVAMKVVLQERASDETLARFMREAAVMARLEHPNIVPIHELGRDADGNLFYTMKRVEGRTLRAILSALAEGDSATIAHYTLDRLLDIFAKICDAIAFAHSKGVIHRDLKPENVMVGAFGEVLVMDWGLAKVMDDDPENGIGPLPGSSVSGSSPDVAAAPPDGIVDIGDSYLSDLQSGQLTMDGMIMGSPQFMPPEQADGRIADTGPHSDIYSLGGILYNILTLHPPIQGTKVREVLANVRSGNIAPPTQYNPGLSGRFESAEETEPDQIPSLGLIHCPGRRVPTPLSAVCMTALSREPADRYPLVQQLAADIENYQRGYATSVEELSALGQFLLLLKRNRGISLATAISLVVITGLTTWFIIGLNTEKQAALSAADDATRQKEFALQSAEEARQSEARAQIALAEAAFRSRNVAQLRAALNACPEAYRNHEWRYLYAKLDSSFGRLTLPDLVVEQTFAIPGRPRQFLFAGKPGALAIVNALTKQVVQSVSVGIVGAKHIAISGNGKRLAVCGPKAKGILLFDLESGQRIKSLRTVKEKLSYLALNHDGTKVAAAVRQSKGPNELHLVDTHSGSLLWSTILDVGSVVFLPDDKRLTVASPLQRRLNILDATTGKIVKRLKIHATSQALSPKGNRLAVGTGNGLLYLVNPATGEILRSGKLYPRDIVKVVWTKDERLIVMGGSDGMENEKWSVSLWEPDNLTTLGSYFGFLKKTTLRWDFDPESGLLINNGKRPRLWRIPVGLEAFRYVGQTETGDACSFLSDDILLARKQRFELSGDTRLERLPDVSEATGPAGSSAGHCSSNLFAIAFQKSLQLFSSQGRTATELWKTPIKYPVAISFDPAANHLLLVRHFTTMEIIDVRAGNSLFELPPLPNATPNVDRLACFAGTNSTLALVFPHKRKGEGMINRVVLLDYATGKQLKTAVMNHRIDVLARSPDGRLLAIGGSDQNVRILDAATLEVRHHFRAHDGDVTALSFHPTKSRIATGARDGSVKLWDYRTGKELEYFAGLIDTPRWLAINPSGTRLAVDGSGYAFRIFEIGEHSSHVANQLNQEHRERIGTTPERRQGSQPGSTTTAPATSHGTVKPHTRTGSPADPRIVGRYAMRNQDNDWHSGRIQSVRGKPGRFTWINDAGTTWGLKLESGTNLVTDVRNPYRNDRQAFQLKFPDAGDNRTNRATGFRFGKEFYDRQP